MAVNKAKALKAADKYIAKQNYNKALNELLKVIKESPNDANLLNKIGDLYSKLGKEASAIGYFQKVAESYQKGGFNLKAIALYKKIIRLDSKFMDARHKLVDLYIQQGLHSETKGELRSMAEYYYSEDLFPRALSCYEKMVEIEPHNLDARIKITEILVREGRREEATEHFVAMGNELLEKTMINEAKKIIGQGLKMAPEHPGLLILLSRTFIGEGKIDEALTHLTDICERDHDNLEALRLLGQTYLTKGMNQEAKHCFLRSIYLSKDEFGPLEELARRFIESGEINEAYECILPVSEVFLEKDDYEEVTRLFRTILYADENHLPSQEMLVQVYRKSNQTSNAILSLEKIIRLLLDRGDDDKAAEKMREILDLDPDNQEWLAKLREIDSDGFASDFENDEIHVFDEPEPEQVPVIEDKSIEIELSESGDKSASNDQSSQLENHITEADVFIKYGIIDQALEHLEKAKDLDFLNVEVNLRLKRIYLDKGMTKKAILCMVSLLNACLEKQEFERARAVIKEIAEYEPEVAAIHTERLNDMEGKSASHLSINVDEGFALDFGDAKPPEPPSEEILFDSPQSNPEVVDFREMAQGGTVAMPGAETPAASDGAWSLDIPDTSKEADEPAGFAEDFRDLYRDSGVMGADELPGLDALSDDSRLDLSLTNIPDDYIDEAALGTGGERGIAAEKPSPPKTQPLDQPPEIKGGTQPIDLDLDMEMDEEPEPSLELGADLDKAVLELDESMSNIQTPPEPVAAKPKAAPAPLGQSGQGSLASELEEIDFFISVEAFEDARNLIEQAREAFGEHPLLMERDHEVQAKTQSAPKQPLGSGEKAPKKENLLADALGDEAAGSGFFDLAAELSEELFEDSGEVNDATSQEEIQSVEELFQEFKKGVEEQIEEGDHETHYDLGIAYKEMGLLEEAISEFEKAGRDPARTLECATMIGNCLIELGRVEETIALYDKHLAKEGLDASMALAFRYEQALAYQGLGELEKALEGFQHIAATDPNYRDVQQYIEALI